MEKNSTFVRIVLLATVLAFAAFGFVSCEKSTNQNSNTNTQTNSGTKPAKVCDASTDTAIESAFGVKLKEDADLTNQLKQINYFSKDCVLTLRGWTNGFKNFKKVYKHASTTADVTQVNIDNFGIDTSEVKLRDPVDGMCPSGMKACGDFCIPDYEKCSIGQDLSAKPNVTPPK